MFLSLPRRISSKNGFSLQDFNDDLIKENLKVDWNGYVSNLNESGKEVREYAAKLTNDMVINQGEIELYAQYSVLATKENGSSKWEYAVLKYVVEEQDLLKNVSFFSKENFAGAVYTLNLKGNLEDVQVFADGEQMAMVKNRKKGTLSLTAREDAWCVGYWCDNGGGSGGGGRMIWVKTTTYTDFYNVRSNGTRGQFNAEDGDKIPFIKDKNSTIGEVRAKHKVLGILDYSKITFNDELNKGILIFGAHRHG